MDVKKYSLIYADPAWAFNNKKTGGSMKSGSVNHYPVMSLEDICMLDVPSISADDSLLFMWWVGSQAREAINVCGSWGFELKTMTAFTWVKKTKYWKDWFGMGFWTRQGTENMLLGVKGNIKRVSAGIRQVVEEDEPFPEESIKAKCEGHSRKPAIFGERIVDLCGDVPRVELFSRNCSDNGWDHVGNEIDGRDISNVIGVRSC